jgi:hypothetical protein
MAASPAVGSGGVNLDELSDEEYEKYLATKAAEKAGALAKLKADILAGEIQVKPLPITTNKLVKES